MIKFALHDDYNEIIRLWNICFGDPESYIINFMNHLVTLDNCLIYKEDAEICAMLFMLNGNVKTGSICYSARYIYAACTKPSYRNRGIMARLIKHASEYAFDNGNDFLCLVPANESLFEYYAKLGFKKVFKKKVLTINRSALNLIADKESVCYSPVIEEVTVIRDKALSPYDYFSWGNDVIGYSLAENNIAGGISVFARYDGSPAGYAIFSESNDKVNVKEFCALQGHTGHLMKVLLESSSKDIFSFQLPIDFPFSSDNLFITDNGMALPLSEQAKNVLKRMRNAYIGLTLE